jgi:hypothetical protein
MNETPMPDEAPMPDELYPPASGLAAIARDWDPPPPAVFQQPRIAGEWLAHVQVPDDEDDQGDDDVVDEDAPFDPPAPGVFAHDVDPAGA